MVSDASSEDWATIGVKIMSIALIPQGGGGNVTVYSAPSPVPTTNLVLLDQLDELLGNAGIPAGTYSGAILTVSANPGDILLTTAASPEMGFAAPAGATIPSTEIQVQHTQGAAGNLTVPVTVNFDSPLVVSSTQNNALDLEFNLAHPAFLIGHAPVDGGATLWAVNFDGPVRRLARHDLTRLVLRHMYGDVTAISSDSTSITVTKEFPTEPPVNPETAVAGSQSLQITADSVNGTILYDLDAKTRTVIDNFSSESSLVGRYVRIAARYQENGTLVATRIYASNEFDNVWVSPEGHVLHVNTTSDMVTVENESGIGVPLLVNADTQFFFREPYNPTADSKPIGSGPAFLSSEDLVRGFKVHATVVDPLATPLVAQNIEIETARYEGTISSPSTASFMYTRKFGFSSDDYIYTHELHLGHDAERQGLQRRCDHGIQVVELRLSDRAHGRLRSGERVRRGHRRQCELRRHRGRGAFLRSELLDLERSGESGRLGGVCEHPDALALAARRCRDRPHRRLVHHDGRRRHHAGHGGCEHHVRFRDARLSDRSDERLPDGEPDRHHHERGPCRLDRGPRRGRARQGVRNTAGRFDPAGLCDRLLHGNHADQLGP